jgi:ABC-2 type transport system ATP-binding protein
MQIAIESASFTYRKQPRPAIDALTCTITPGITGLIGPNGAGKTTLFRMLLGALAPDRGSIRIVGLEPDQFRRSGQMGFIPDKPVFPPALSVRDFLQGLFRLHGHPHEIPVTIASLADKRLDSLSLGEARKVELAAAACTRPAVLLLDEPTNALDPHAVLDLRNQLHELDDGNRIILIASHHLDELQRLANAVFVIDQGRLAGSLDQNRLNDPLALEHAFHTLTTPRSV